VYLELVDAARNTSFDVYVDLAGGGGGVHARVGTFTTDGSGAATFTGAIDVPSVGSRIDNEVVLRNASPSEHQYIRELFEPCPE
jgi:hypothetical protein